MLQQQKITIGADGGTDSTQEEKAPQAQINRVENGEWVKRRGIAKRRSFQALANSVDDGTDRGLPVVSTLSNVRAVFATGAELCVVDGTSVCAWDTVRGTWARRPGYCSPFGLTLDTLIRDEASFPQCDVDQITGWRILVTSVYQVTWVGASLATFSGLSFTIYSDAGQVVAHRELVGLSSTGTNAPHAVRAAHIGSTKLVAMWMDSLTAPSNIKCKVIDVTGLSPVNATLAADCDADTFPEAGGPAQPRGKRMFDVIGSRYEPKMFLAYIRNTDGHIIVKRLDTALSVTHTLDISTHAPYARVTLCESETADRIYVVGYARGTGETPVGIIDITRCTRSALGSSSNAVLWNGVLPYNQSSLGQPNCDNFGVVEAYVAATQKVLTVWGNRTDFATTMQCVTCDTNLGTISAIKSAPNQLPITRPWGDSTTQTIYVTSAVDHEIGDTALSQEWQLIASSNTLCCTHDVGGFMAGTALIPQTAGQHHYGLAPFRTKSSVGLGAFCAGNGGNVIGYAAHTQYGTNRISYAVPVRVFSTYDNLIKWDPRWGCDLVTLDSTAPIGACAVYDRCAVIGGALISWYDGDRVTELGHLHAPKVYQIETSNTTNGELEDVVCTVSATFESRDNAGTLHRGPPTGASAQHTPTAGNDTLNIDVQSTCATNRQNSLVVTSKIGDQLGCVLYRSQGGGRLVRALAPTAGYNNKVQASGAGVTPTDGVMNDDGHVNGEELYTLEGELEAAPATPAAFPAIANERLWLARCARRSEARHSKRFFVESGVRVAPELHDQLTAYAPGDEQMVAAAPLDDKTILFTSTRTYALAGQGPDDTGQNSDWGQLALLSADVGCLDARSVCSTPVGVFFQAQTGLIHLIDRSGAVEPLGEKVRDDLASYPNVTSAVLVRDRYQVRFTCLNASNTFGIILTYDYRVAAWSTWTIGAVAAEVGKGIGFVGAAVRPTDGAYVAVAANGVGRVEDRTQWLEPDTANTTTYYPLAIETTVLQQAGQSGTMRAWAWYVLADHKSSHGYNVRLYWDFAHTTSFAPPAIPAATVDAWAELTSREQPRIMIPTWRQVSQAQKIRVEDFGDYRAGTGEGWLFISATMHYGLKKPTVAVARAARS